MSQIYVCQVEEDGTLQLPEQILKELGWKTGDVLHWVAKEKGSVSVRKCTEITPIDLHVWFDDYWESLEAGEAFVIGDVSGRYLLAPVDVALTSLSQVTSEPT